VRLFFDDEGFDGQLQRSVGKCDSGMANVGECLYIASQITAGDRDSWYAAWSGFADGLARQADTALAAGRTVSAASLYLRAAEYYRQAFFWHRDDLDGKELTTAYRASVTAFRAALPHLDRPGVVVEGATPGYFFAPEGDGPFPTILHIGGYDGTAEELYASVYSALDRGWAIAVLDGPGTGQVLYDRRQAMRPDWENVVPGMVDVVLAQPEVDPSRVVLVGRSFGGLLAPRGASGEPRLAAMVVDPGQYDMSQAMATRLGDLWKSIDDPAADPQFDALLQIPALKVFLGPRMVTHDVTTPRAYFEDMRRYTCVEQAPRIACPSLVTDNETDLVSTGQGQQLFDALTCPKTFRRFLLSEGAEGHCEGMAQIVFLTAAFDWLEQTLDEGRRASTRGAPPAGR
jgi:pimeloyl-ACP methyl ester carboxylesterase